MKKVLLGLGVLVILASQSFAADLKKVTIGVTPFPHADIMRIAQPLLEKEGYQLEIKEFSDYVLPNTVLAEGQIDANFMEHIPYLDTINKERNLKLVWVAKVHIEPMGLYSKKIKSFDEIKQGDTISVPSDPTNGARALRLLEAHGLFKLKDGDLVTARDIIDNPKKIKVIELEAPQLPRTLSDVTASVINTNFATEANLIPSKDAIIIEGKDSPFANVIVVREADKDSDFTKALIKAVNSKEVKDFIVNELEPKGILPAF